jgi:hypothetical protein
VVASPGRLGRAAVFAGATLAGTACWTDAPAPRTTPVDTRHHDDWAAKHDDLAPGTIRGTLRNGASGQPLPGYPVTVRSRDGQTVQDAVTDQYGAFVFTGLMPGEYTVMHQPNNPHHSVSQIQVTLSVDAGQRVDLPVYVPPPDRGPCCKPYGAPPARRRIV